MFHLKSQVFAFCPLLAITLTILISGLQAQSYFHTSLGNSGSYSSITYGSAGNRPTAPQPPPRPAYAAPPPAYAAPPKPAYAAPPPQPSYAAAPKPAYAAPQRAYAAPQPAYAAPQPAYAAAPLKPAYSPPPPPQPAYVASSQQPQSYAHPQPAYAAPQARAEPLSYDNEKCILDYPDKYAEVCVPTLKTDCVNEQIKDGLKLYDEESCYTVTKSVCTEAEEVELVDVCAVAYKLEQTQAEAKLVDVAWEKVCIEEKQECVVSPGYGAAAHSSPGYGAPAAPYCAEKIKITCKSEPVLVPVVAAVTLKLPKPVDTCITKEIVLPRVKCQQVSEKKCSHAPKVVPGESLLLEKCSVSVEGEACAEAVLQLPRQACVATVKKIKTIYVDEKVAKSY